MVLPKLGAYIQRKMSINRAVGDSSDRRDPSVTRNATSHYEVVRMENNQQQQVARVVPKTRETASEYEDVRPSYQQSYGQHHSHHRKQPQNGSDCARWECCPQSVYDSRRGPWQLGPTQQPSRNFPRTSAGAFTTAPKMRIMGVSHHPPAPQQQQQPPPPPRQQQQQPRQTQPVPPPATRQTTHHGPSHSSSSSSSSATINLPPSRVDSGHETLPDDYELTDEEEDSESPTPTLPSFPPPDDPTASLPMTMSMSMPVIPPPPPPMATHPHRQQQDYVNSNCQQMSASFYGTINGGKVDTNDRPPSVNSLASIPLSFNDSDGSDEKTTKFVDQNYTNNIYDTIDHNLKNNRNNAESSTNGSGNRREPVMNGANNGGNNSGQPRSTASSGLRKSSSVTNYPLNDHHLSLPPKITPVSGVLSAGSGKSVIRPIAFRPVVSGARYTSTPSISRSGSMSSNQDSAELRACGSYAALRRISPACSSPGQPTSATPTTSRVNGTNGPHQTMLERADSFGGRSSSFAPPMYASYSDLYRMRNSVNNNSSIGVPLMTSTPAGSASKVMMSHSSQQLNSLPLRMQQQASSTLSRDIRRHGSIDIDRTMGPMQQQSQQPQSMQPVPSGNNRNTTVVQVNGNNPERYDSFGDPRYDSCLRLTGRNPLSLPPRNPPSGPSSMVMTSSMTAASSTSSTPTIRPRLSGSVDDVTTQIQVNNSTPPVLSNTASLTRPHHRHHQRAMAALAASMSTSNVNGAVRHHQNRPLTMYSSSTLPHSSSSTPLAGIGLSSSVTVLSGEDSTNHYETVSSGKQASVDRSESDRYIHRQQHPRHHQLSSSSSSGTVTGASSVDYSSNNANNRDSRANSEVSAISSLMNNNRLCSNRRQRRLDDEDDYVGVDGVLDDDEDDECPTPSQDSDLTPSPSDSGVAELEAMIREKNSEITTLRASMEEKEQVISKVVEEKDKSWERELRKIKGMYENRLKSAQQRALKIEQSLTTQNYQLQQEKRKQRNEIDELRREKGLWESQNVLIKKELQALRTQLEETEWTMCQKNGEISLLKSQLKESHGDQTTRGHEMIGLRTQLRDTHALVDKKQKELRALQDQVAALNQNIRRCKVCGNSSNMTPPANNSSSYMVNAQPAIARQPLPPLPHQQQQQQHPGASKTMIVSNTPPIGPNHQYPNEPMKHASLERNRYGPGSAATLERDIRAKMERELADIRKELREERENFEGERASWLEEKEKVIKYQKQLQMNYVQMFRRTKALEEELAKERGTEGKHGQQIQHHQQQVRRHMPPQQQGHQQRGNSTPSPAPRTKTLLTETHC